MKILRMLKHLCQGEISRQRAFPAPVLARIEGAVRACEQRQPGQIRFVIEAALPWPALVAGQSARERAVDVFAMQRVWDTEHNDGVLIYLLLADRDVEIVADRGVAGGVVPQGEWERCCRVMEEHFRAGRFEAGAVAGVEAVASVLAAHPAGPRAPGNELADSPVVL